MSDIAAIGTTVPPDASATGSWDHGQVSKILTAESAGWRVSDTITLSPEARTLLAALDTLANVEASMQAARRPGGGSPVTSSSGMFSDPAGPAFASIASDGVGASMKAFTSTHAGQTTLYMIVNGSRAGNDLINVAAFSNDAQPGNSASVQVNAGDGNDTINAASNGGIVINAGNGNDNITATAIGPNGGAYVSVGSGNDLINLNGSGGAYGGSGNDVINLRYTGGSNLTFAEAGAGHTTITGSGFGTLADGGKGTTTINNVDQVIAGQGNDTISFGNSSYTSVVFQPTFGNAVVNLSDPSASVSNNASRPGSYAEGGLTFDSKGHRMAVIAADTNGNYSGQYVNYLDVLPTQGQAGDGLAHTRFDFRNFTANQIDSHLQGSTLTLTVRDTGQSIVVNNYQPGRITFTFLDDSTGNLTASRQPPGLSADAVPSA
jgi:hypothetical protein